MDFSRDSHVKFNTQMVGISCSPETHVNYKQSIECSECRWLDGLASSKDDTAFTRISTLTDCDQKSSKILEFYLSKAVIPPRMLFLSPPRIKHFIKSDKTIHTAQNSESKKSKTTIIQSWQAATHTLPKYNGRLWLGYHILTIPGRGLSITSGVSRANNEFQRMMRSFVS